MKNIEYGGKNTYFYFPPKGASHPSNGLEPFEELIKTLREIIQKAGHLNETLQYSKKTEVFFKSEK